MEDPDNIAAPEILLNNDPESQLVDINNRYLITNNDNDNNKLIDSPPQGVYYEYDSDVEYVAPPKFIPKPSESIIESLRGKFPILFEGKVHKGAGSLQDINYLLIPDYLENWTILPSEVKQAFKEVVESNWDGKNWNQSGIKRKSSDHPLIDHLLFNIGCEVWSKVPRETDVIHSSLKGDLDDYHSKTSSRRYINPNAAAKEINNRNSHWNPELLYREMDSISVLFETSSRIFEKSDPLDLKRKKCRDYFHKNLLSVKRIKKAMSFVISHEIGLSSIRHNEFKPHSHAILWFLKDEELTFLERLQSGGILKFRPEDRNTAWDGEKNMWNYIVKTQNIADVYRREWSELGIREFNNSAKEAIREFIQLHYGEPLRNADKKGKKMIYWSRIPSVTNTDNGKYHHHLLEKHKEKITKEAE